MKGLLRGKMGDEPLFARFSQAHDEGNGMLKCEVIFSRIGSLIYWINLEQPEVFL